MSDMLIFIFTMPFSDVFHESNNMTIMNTEKEMLKLKPQNQKSTELLTKLFIENARMGRFLFLNCP